MVCENYQGNNYCAEEIFAIHFTNFKCQDTDKNVKDCFREMAAECNHKQDLIVECFNQDPENNNLP